VPDWKSGATAAAAGTTLAAAQAGDSIAATAARTETSRDRVFATRM
jgi:hypothetical protein